jgi:hypothetical protein
MGTAHLAPTLESNDDEQRTVEEFGDQLGAIAPIGSEF